MVTSSLVITETHGWFLRRYNNFRANQFLLFVSDLPFIEIISFGDKEVEKSKKILHQFSDQKLTLVDAHGIQIIKERKIKVCWSTDRHFSLSNSTLVIDLIE